MQDQRDAAVPRQIIGMDVHAPRQHRKEQPKAGATEDLQPRALSRTEIARGQVDLEIDPLDQAGRYAGRDRDGKGGLDNLVGSGDQSDRKPTLEDIDDRDAGDEKHAANADDGNSVRGLAEALLQPIN